MYAHLEKATGRDLGAVIITLTTSVQTLDAAGRAAMSTELMPGEDPALLPGPDRIEIHHVTGYLSTGPSFRVRSSTCSCI